MHTFVLAIQMVVLNTRVNAGARPLAIVSSLLYCVLFRNSRLQGDASLQMLFAVVAPRGRSRRGVGWQSPPPRLVRSLVDAPQ